MAEVGTIPRRGHNKFHNYYYVLMDDLLEAITPLMGKHGLAIMQNEISINQVEGNRVAVGYDFHVIHESGETYPPMHGTGMATARDSKGNWDDKALNKARTAARKYFYLSLFNVPAGDFDDNDADEGTAARAEQRAVPGPRTTGAPAGARTATVGTTAPKQPDKEDVPHRLVLPPGTSAENWAAAYLKIIGRAKSQEEITQWDQHNDDFLQRINDRYAPLYEMLRSAVGRRLADVTRMPAGMPDPKVEAQEAMNWIAGQLASFKQYETAEKFWNDIVAPREADFDVVDWDLLLREWQRTEQHLKPPADDEEIAKDEL